ncbi:ABC transporter substrate-binding protein [Cohnella hongkongensis]|uniref:ABC transporter substrate-binding protein n=1 Tax=Cohnella hongkongensis TaxID=178337 RepID=A0ABV9FAX4_9BACL
MKRKWLTAAVICIALTVIAACGGSANEAGNSADGTPVHTSIHSQAGLSEQQRVVESVKGNISIPANPEKVIGLSVVYPEFLYALGVVPIAVQNYHADFPSYLEQPFKDTIKMGIARTPDFEAILAAEPDLILAPVWWSEKDYDQLSQIAPTVLLPQRDNWRDELRDIAAVLGKEEQAEQVIADLKAKEVEAAKKLDNLVGEETVLYIRVMAKEIIVHGENIDRGSLVHKQLGLRPVDNFPQSETALSISLEMMPEYNADHLIVQLDDEANDEVQKQFSGMIDTSLWKGLKAVQKDRIYRVGGKEWFNVGMSPLADSFAIDAIVSAFEQKLQ